MAIPVSNPPPRYEPTPPAAPEPPGLPGRPPPGEGSPPPSPLLRGCMLIIGMAAALGCLATMALAFSCRDVLRIAETEGTRQIATAYRMAAMRAGEEPTYDADLDALESLGETGAISIIAFGILNQRFQNAMANDRTIDADELVDGMALVHDIVVGHGDVDPTRYPEARR